MGADNTAGKSGGPPASVPPATASREWQTRLMATLDALPDLLFILDRNGQVLDFHAPSRIGLFLPPERFVGQMAVDLLPEPAAAVVRQAIAEALATGHHQGGTYALAMPHGERWFELSIAAHGDLNSDEARLVAIARDVTDRKRTDDALRASEEKYRLLTEGMKDVVWVLDVEAQRFTYVSPSVVHLRGYTAAEILAQPLAEAWVPEEREKLFKLMQGYVADFLAGKITEDTYVSIEFLQPCKDGATLPSEAICHLVRNARSGRLELHGVTRDVSGRVRAETALRESHERFAQTAQIGRAFVWEVDADGLYMFVTPVVEDVLGYRPDEIAGRLHFYDLHPAEGRDAFRTAVFAAMGRREKFRDHENPMVAKDGRTMWVSTNAFPLLDPTGALLGYRGVDFDVTVRKQAEEALKTSETRYRELIDLAVDGILLGAPDGVIAEANACMCALAGRTRSELVGRHVAELFAPETLDAAPMRFDLLNKGETVTRVRKIVRPDASEVFVEMHSKRMPDGNYQAILHDITQRKQAEEALRLSEAKYRQLHESMRDAFAAADMRGRIQDFNPAFRKLTGYSAAELRNMNYRQLTPRKWQAAEAKILKEQVLTRGYSDVYEKEYRRKDGTIVPVELRTLLIRDAAGQATGMWATIRDVSERQRVQEALRKSETKYRLLFENMRDAFAAMDLQGRLGDCNPAFEKLVGYSRNEVLRLRLADITPKEWLAVEQKAIAEMRRRGYSNPFEKEYVRKDGTRVPVELQGSLIRDARGRPAGAWAIIRDVSERKRAETELRQAHDELERRVRERTAELETSRQALAQSEEQFRQMAESIQEVFWLLDVRTGRALYVSPAFEAIWGRPGQTLHNGLAQWLATLHPDDRGTVQRDFERGVRTGTFTPLEYRILWPDGTVRWIRDSAWGIRDRRGRVVRVAGVFRDITDQRRLEAELLKTAEAERQRIGRDLHDSLGQSLTAIGYLADAVREDLARARRPEAAAVKKLGRLIGKTAAEAHALARGLLLADLKRGGLAAALQELAFRTQELFGNACRYAGPGTLPPLDVQTAGQLYRIAQEAVTNAGKHGKAKRIEIRLAKDRRGLLLSVRDTGKGIAAKTKTGSGLGLDIMRYRAGLIGATLWIDSPPRGGTTVNCLLPRAATAPKRKT
jgi:PAS domain S-box-containing protein